MLYDAAITGGGLVGSSLALALADAGYKIQLIDAKPCVNILPESLDLRVVALSKTSLDWLNQINVRSLLKSERVGHFETVSVCEDDVNNPLNFNSDTIPLDYLGIIVENQHVLYALHQRVMNHKHIHHQFSSQFQDIHAIDATLIIGADGADSELRRQLGITVQHKNYHQRALVCYVHTEKPHQHIAWQRFLPTGPIAFLPMHDETVSSIVWTLPEQEAKEKQSLSIENLSVEITQATQQYFGKVKIISKVASFPLRMQHAHDYGAQHCILLGDAIHTIHPLAGQGVNLGFADAQCLYQLLKATPTQHWRHVLLRQKFERARRGHNTLIMRSMNGFLNQPVRRVGIRIFRHSSWLKKMATLVAMG